MSLAIGTGWQIGGGWIFLGGPTAGSFITTLSGDTLTTISGNLLITS